MTDSVIDVIDDPERSAYVATIDGRPGGTLAYRRDDGVIDLVHTVIRRDAEGHGVGSALVRTALDAARAAGDRVIPTCPFVQEFLGRHPEYDDLVTAP